MTADEPTRNLRVVAPIILHIFILYQFFEILCANVQENHIKVVATRGQILRLKCTQFDFGVVPPKTLLGSSQHSPDP